MTVKLSICIPTYNRERYLKELLDSILENGISEDNLGKIEICISDNDSEDNTEQIVNEISKTSKIPVVYNKNPKNMGADYNFLKVVEIANGEYCWLMGSDDKIEPSGINYVIDKIESNKNIDIFVLTNDCYTSDFKDRLEEHHSFLLNHKDDVYYNNINKILAEVTYALGYISILCFKKSLWEAIDGCERFIGSAYVHTYKILSMIKNGAQLMYVRRPVVGWRAGNDSFYAGDTFNRLRIDIEGYSKISAHVFGRLSSEHMAVLESVLRVHFTPVRISGTCVRTSTYNRYRLIKLMFKNDYYKTTKFWYKALPFFFVPKTIYFFLRNIKKSFKKYYA
ncbi:MAG: glycosyltransferase family 2 protein [Candidatus Micrarchaeaceae archaeon]